MALALPLAALLHAALILGLGSPSAVAPPAPAVVEVTLAPKLAPKEAPVPAAGMLAQEREASVRGEAPPAPSGLPQESAERSAAKAGTRVASASHPTAASATPPLPRHYAALVRGVALTAANQPPEAGELRVRRVRESAAAGSDGWYLAAWRRKVERVGQLNYPEAARRRKLQGSLRLLVAIEADGTLREARVLESSGHAELDAAAVRIAQLAAPFSPLPPAMRRNTDVLEIVRTWQFRRGPLLAAAS